MEHINAVSKIRLLTDLNVIGDADKNSKVANEVEIKLLFGSFVILWNPSITLQQRHVSFFHVFNFFQTTFLKNGALLLK